MTPPPSQQHPAVAYPLMTSSNTRPGAVRLASLRFGLAACLMLISACTTEVADAPIDESEPGSSQQQQSVWGVGALVSRYWADARCVDSEGQFYPGAMLYEETCLWNTAQQFKVVKNDDNSWSFEARGAWGQSLCIDVASASRDNGARVHLWTCNGTGAQKFWAIPTQYGWYAYKNVNSNKCLDLDIQGNNPWGPTGARLQQWDCNLGSNNQQFYIKRL